MNNVIYLDVGNYSTLAHSEGIYNPKQRSLVFDCTYNTDCQNNVHTPDSPLVIIGAKKYKLGKLAAKYDGFLSAAEFGKSKPELLLPFLLANTPDGFEGTVKMLVPDDNHDNQTFIRNTVIGTHEYQVVVEGTQQSRLVNFTSLEFARETDSAARFAYSSGQLSTDDVALVIDIGGGTANIAVCDNEDGVFTVSFRKSYPSQGGINLAQIILNTDLVKSYCRPFEVSKVMDAIANNKTYIGNRKDFTFEPVLNDCIDQWFKALVSKVMASVDKRLDDITRIVWVGGGAEIIRSKVADKEMHLVLPEPQLANLRGLIDSNKPHLELVA